MVELKPKLQGLFLVDSKTDVLEANETYTSPTFNLSGYRKIVGSVIADQVGTLYVEQSQDNVNWDMRSSYPVAADVMIGFISPVLAPYGRVRYVNGGTTQTKFRLYTNLRVI